MIKSQIKFPQEMIESFCRRYGVVELALFGSVLRDDFGPDSDIDVMLTFAPGHGFTFDNTPEIYEELEEIFGRPVDVIEKGSITNPFRRASIMKSYQVVYAA
jgi:hypothetical protein